MHIEPVWTKPEEKVVRALYEKLRSTFGITLVNQNLTLRFAEGNVNLMILGVEPDRESAGECHLCGSRHHLKPAAVVLTHANGDTTEFKTHTCVDCRCPQ